MRTNVHVSSKNCNSNLSVGWPVGYWPCTELERQRQNVIIFPNMTCFLINNLRNDLKRRTYKTRTYDFSIFTIRISENSSVFDAQFCRTR